jgi:hypothetical protein
MTGGNQGNQMIADLGLAHCTAVGESGGKKKIHESAEGRHRWQSERPSAVFRSTQCQRQKKPARGRAKAILISLAHADAGYESKACLIPPGWYETATSTNMVGLRGRCLRGEQLVSLVPHGHWKTITFVAGLRHDGIVALFVIDGAMNGPTFLAYVERCLAPTLGRRDIVIMDNLPAHKMAGVAEAIEAFGASVLYLPSYSPDLNPIDHQT